MEKLYSVRRPVLTTGITGAALLWFAAGPAFAGHGLAMKEHPLRGDFPTATDKAETAPANDAEVAEARPAPRQRNEARSWLRGDFPTATENRSEPVLVVRRGLGETWNCSVDQASAKNLDIGTIQAVLRVIHTNQ